MGNEVMKASRSEAARARQGYAGGIDLSREGVFVAIVGQGRSLNTALGTLPILTDTVISFWKGLSWSQS
ncbi:MAG: hypothetical protein MUP73_00540 [Dehalococcoidia bacterium]|nr:hypothetical protein [Dehalococcoidia bacterium]